MSEQRDCERCGNPIPPQRLEVLPHTRLCIECSEAIGGDFKTYVIAENTHGKSGGRCREHRRRDVRSTAPYAREALVESNEDRAVLRAKLTSDYREFICRGADVA